MQFSSLLSAVAALTLASATKLPSTVTLYALQGTTQTGCINGYGNYTRNMQWCFPFRVFPTTGDDAVLKGYNNCTVGAGILDCGQSAPKTLGAFTQSGSYLAIDTAGKLNTNFSINTNPTADDNVGVPTVVGTGGKFAQLKLSVKATSG